MTEESNLEDLLGLEPTPDEEIITIPEIEELPDSKNEVSPQQEKQFLKEVLGSDEAVQEALSIDEQYKEMNKWEHRSPNPQNKPVHESVTETYHTEGGKEVKAVHDEFGSMWHIEFSPGGELPHELKGRFTTEQDARQAIKMYLAKRKSQS